MRERWTAWKQSAMSYNSGGDSLFVAALDRSGHYDMQQFMRHKFLFLYSHIEQSSYAIITSESYQP